MEDFEDDDLWDVEEPEEETVAHPRGAYKTKPLPPNDGNDFMKEGACAGWAYKNPDERNLWFSDAGTVEDAKATATCWTCPVRRECLKWATDVREEGTWGGQPSRVRRKHGHNFNILIDLPNPYENPKKTSMYHPDNLKPHTEKD